MNPPFIPWDRMPQESQDITKEILGNLAKFRADLSMAFIWKAAESLTSGAVLATVMPAPLFGTTSGELWRESLASETDIILLGRLEGYGFFRGSAVEPGLIVLRGKSATPERMPESIKVAVAKDGCEDAVLRALRRGVDRSPTPDKWDVFSVSASSITPANWMPRFQRSMKMAEILEAAGMTRVGDLFSVHQGILTGYNKAFVLKVEELTTLPQTEREFFRPAAGNSTIHDGTIAQDRYVFFPYNSSGILVESETDLRILLPSYSAKWLEPHKKELQERAGIDPRQWWLLTRRRSWQMRNRPKLVTTYFGDRGSFGYDKTGAFVVVQGYCWLWKQEAAKKEAPRPSVRFDRSDLPWSYLAILNSGLFETLLESSCPRVQGGQFNLSSRFVNQVFLPNLSDNLCVTGDLVEELASLGRRIHAGDMPEVDQIDEVAVRAYGLPR